MNKNNIIEKSLAVGFFKKVDWREIGGSLLLILATIFSLSIANSVYGEAYISFWQSPLEIRFASFSFSLSLHHWINDGLMAFFFFIVALEIKKEVCEGALSNFKQALFPVVGAVGGMLVPAILYVGLNFQGESLGAWGVPIATDIAFAVGVLTIFKKRVPSVLLIFLLTLATADDLGAIAVIALFYANGVHWISLGLAILVCFALFILNRLGVKRVVPYMFFGVLLWVGLFYSGVNADICGVILAFAIPLRGKEEREVQEQEEDSGFAFEKKYQEYLRVSSPLNRLIYRGRGWSVYGVMPLFALANTALPLSFSDLSSLPGHLSGMGIFLGLFLGKPIGILFFSYFFSRIGVVKLPVGMTWSDVAIAGVLGGIGFTMSIFIADLSFDFGRELTMAKLAVFLASFSSAFLATLVLLFKKKRLVVTR